MGKNFEIERKFVIEVPKSWSDFSSIFDNLVDIKRIKQTYLKPKDNEPSARVRKTVEGLSDNINTIYHYNQKYPVETGVHEEKEKEISKNEYEENLKKCHPDKIEVEKTRFLFEYNDQLFELDVFKGPLKGLAILEIELKSKNQAVDLPTFLKIKKEVTGDKCFSNFSLADKELYKKILANEI